MPSTAAMPAAHAAAMESTAHATAMESAAPAATVGDRLGRKRQRKQRAGRSRDSTIM
jgi:hypothetical protein